MLCWRVSGKGVIFDADQLFLLVDLSELAHNLQPNARLRAGSVPLTRATAQWYKFLTLLACQVLELYRRLIRWHRRNDSS